MVVGEKLDTIVPQEEQVLFLPLRIAPHVWQIRISNLRQLLQQSRAQGACDINLPLSRGL
jgi:hypothetical protein